MPVIHKAPETMTSKERVMRTFAYEKTDRVPIDYSANPTIHSRFCRYLGMPNDDMGKLMDALGCDYRSVWPAFVGENRFPCPEGRNVDPVTGVISRWVENESGGYWDFCDFPLQDADEETIANWHVPSPDEFSFDFIGDALRQHKDYAVYIGSAGTADIINSTGRIMGMEDTLVNLMTEDEATMTYVRRSCALELALMERLLDRFGKQIDFVWIGEDLGTQHTPMISLDMYRRVLRPLHQQYIDLARAYGKPVMVHTCGSSSWVYEDFIDMGVSAVDTLQPEATNMSPAYLKEHFGGRLNFHGCISTAGPLAYGSTDDIIGQVRETLEIMKPGVHGTQTGGYHFSPTHLIQDNTPPENIYAMYQAAHDLGRY